MEVDVQVGNEILTVEAPDDATDEQIIAAVRGGGTQQPATEPAKPEPQRTDLDRVSNLIKAVRTGQPTGTPLLPDVADTLTMPFRGVRATAVGAGDLIAGEGLQKSVKHAERALQPGFKAETPAEKTASLSTGLLELATPGKAATKAPGAIGRLARILSVDFKTIKGARGAVSALKKGAGIGDDIIAETIKNPQHAKNVISSLSKVRETGALKKLSVQDLEIAEQQMRNLLDAEKVGGFQRLLGSKGAGVINDKAQAIAAKNKAAVIQELNSRVKGLEQARQRVGDLETRKRIAKKLIGGSLAAYAAKKVLPSGASSAVDAVSEVSR